MYYFILYLRRCSVKNCRSIFSQKRERERDSNPGFGTDINLKRKRQIASLRGRIFATATTATNEGKRKPREREKFLASNERSNFDGENETKFGKLWNAAEEIEVEEDAVA